jgi:hypothetical protein
MDNVQNCDSYINVPSSQTYRFFLFCLKDPVYLQSVIIHSANGGKGDSIKMLLGS